MKIFMLIKRLRYSGAYKMFMWVANALAEKGHMFYKYLIRRINTAK